MYKFRKIDINLEVDQYPKEYPAFYLFNEDDSNRLKSVLASAMLVGFDPTFKMMCFTGICKEGIKFEDLLQEIKGEFEEIPDDIAAIYHSMPHWNPVKDAIRVLEHFLKVKDVVSGDETELQQKRTLGMEEALAAAEESSQRYDQFYNNPSGAIQDKKETE